MLQYWFECMIYSRRGLSLIPRLHGCLWGYGGSSKCSLVPGSCDSSAWYITQFIPSNSGMLHQHVVIYVGPHIYETIMKYNSIHLKHSSLSVSFNLVPYKGLDCLHQIDQMVLLHRSLIRTFKLAPDSWPFRSFLVAILHPDVTIDLRSFSRNSSSQLSASLCPSLRHRLPA